MASSAQAISSAAAIRRGQAAIAAKQYAKAIGEYRQAESLLPETAVEATFAAHLAEADPISSSLTTSYVGLELRSLPSTGGLWAELGDDGMKAATYRGG